MTPLSCCSDPDWLAERDLGHADSMEFKLGQCARCGALSLNVFCVATGRSGYETLTDADAQPMRTIPAGSALKRFMRAWSRERL